MSTDKERLDAWNLAAERGDFPEEIAGLTAEADGFPFPSGNGSLDLDRIDRWAQARRRPSRVRRLLRFLGWIDRRPGDKWPFPFAALQPRSR